MEHQWQPSLGFQPTSHASHRHRDLVAQRHGVFTGFGKDLGAQSEQSPPLVALLGVEIESVPLVAEAEAIG